MKTKFLIDQHMMSLGDSGLAQKIRNLGFEVEVAGFDPAYSSSKNPVFSDGDCVVMYGSHAFIAQHQKGRGFHPGSYYSTTAYRCSSYYPYLPKSWLANRQYLLLPFGEIMRSLDDLFDLLKTDALFIRPDTGAKVFAGQVIERADKAFQIETLEMLTGAAPTTLCLVAPSRAIGAEYRFFIVGKEVVTGSQYMLNGIPSVSPDVDEKCQVIAQCVADQEWQIDRAYSCDVGIVDGEPLIIELNSFSAAGLYACDAEKLFIAVANEAMRDYEDVMSI